VVTSCELQVTDHENIVVGSRQEAVGSDVTKSYELRVTDQTLEVGGPRLEAKE